MRGGWEGEGCFWLVHLSTSELVGRMGAGPQLRAYPLRFWFLERVSWEDQEKRRGASGRERHPNDSLRGRAPPPQIQNQVFVTSAGPRSKGLRTSGEFRTRFPSQAWNSGEPQFSLYMCLRSLIRMGPQGKEAGLQVA